MMIQLDEFECEALRRRARKRRADPVELARRAQLTDGAYHRLSGGLPVKAPAPTLGWVLDGLAWTTADFYQEAARIGLQRSRGQA
jgi:hypothetical protein